MVNFRNVSLAASFTFLVLAAIWLFYPHLLLSMWGVSYSEITGLVGRRSAALFLGLATMLYLMRNAAASQSRLAITAGIIVLCVSLAFLGGYEFLMGRVGSGIFLAIFVEALFAFLFFLVERKENINT